MRLGLVEFETEAGKPLAGAPVERLPILLRGLFVEGLGVGLAELDEEVAAGVREVDEIAVALLGLLPRGGVVGAERGLGVVDETAVLGCEEVELPLYEVGEPAAHRPRLVAPVGLLVRTWNLFHGQTVPERRRLELERMVRLVTQDRPALVGLQEVPVWALERLEEWSGMRAVWAVAMPALGGPFARRLTELDPRRVRSALVGQANALLLGEELAPAGGQRVVRLNPGSLRRSRRVPLAQRLDWVRNRRVCQVVPVRAGATSLRAVNLHASKHAELARVELERLAVLLSERKTIVLGDFNSPGTGLSGFSDPIAGIDQILARGVEFEKPPEPWPAHRRRHGTALLSDHAPVEATLALVGSRTS